MPHYFLDSSALAKRFVAESGSGFLIGLFRERAGKLIFVSRLTLVEVSSALVRKAFTNQISSDAEARASRRLRRAFESQLIVVEITEKLVSEAVVLARRHRLRGYDAVQLASALEISINRFSHRSAAVFVSSDNELNKAAMAEGLAVDDPNVH